MASSAINPHRARKAVRLLIAEVDPTSHRKPTEMLRKGGDEVDVAVNC